MKNPAVYSCPVYSTKIVEKTNFENYALDFVAVT
jgi:hypothetical protein